MANTTITPNVGVLKMTTVVVAPIVALAGALAMSGASPVVINSTGAIVPKTGALVMTTANAGSPVFSSQAGALSLIGTQPGIVQTGRGPSLTPGAGALVMTTAGNSNPVPQAGGLSMVGNAPTVLVPVAAIVPGVGSLSIASAIVSQLLTLPPPAAAALALTGLAPVVLPSVTVVPGAGSLALSGNVPVFLGKILTGVGSLSVVGQSGPRLNVSMVPSAASLGIVGTQPLQAAKITVNQGALSISGQAASLNASLVITPSVGALAFASAAPTLNISYSFAPPTAALNLTGNAPQPNQLTTVTPNSGALSMVGNAPALANIVGRVPAAGSLAITGAAPALTGGLTIAPNAGALSVNGAVPPAVAQTGNQFSPPQSGSLNFTGDAPIVTQALSGGTFEDINLVRTYPNIWPFNVRPQPYGEFYLSVGDVERFGIDFSGMLANRWTMATLASVGTTIRPSVPNGYQYACSQAGQTGATEPFWPPVAGAQLLDGSVQWTAEAVDTTSLEGTLTTANWAAPTGIVLSFSAIQDQTALITVDATNAVSGTDYNVVCTATFSPSPPQVIGTIRVKVR